MVILGMGYGIVLITLPSGYLTLPWRITIFKNGNPSISIGPAIFHGYVKFQMVVLIKFQMVVLSPRNSKAGPGRNAPEGPEGPGRVFIDMAYPVR